MTESVRRAWSSSYNLDIKAVYCQPCVQKYLKAQETTFVDVSGPL